MPRGAGVRLKDLPPEMREAARAMKREAAEAERRAACDYFEAAGLPRPKAEHRFHPCRKWRMDFAWPGVRVALEVEGGVWSGGRHTHPSGFLRDMAKYNAAAVAGWRVLRCTPEQLYEPSTVALVAEALERAQADAA